MAFDDLEVVQVRSGARVAARDRVAIEEPLEIRLHGRPFAVIMRTPGADIDLAAGFLFAERIVRSADEIGTIRHCTEGDDSAAVFENVVNVSLAGTAGANVEAALAARRHVVS